MPAAKGEKAFTVFVPETVYEALRHESFERNSTFKAIVNEALRNRLRDRLKALKKPSVPVSPTAASA